MNKRAIHLKSLFFDISTLAYLLLIAWYVVFSPDEATLMNLKFISVLIFALVLLSTFVVAGLRKLNIRTLGKNIFASALEKLSWAQAPLLKTFWGWQLLVTLVVTLIVGAFVTDFNLYEVFDQFGFEGAKRIFWALLTPEWSVLPRGILAIVETIYMAFMATALAIPVSFLLAFFAAKNIASENPFLQIIYIILRGLMNISRSIEPLIWAIIFSVWVGIGPFAGLLALLLHSIASLTKQYSEIIECVEEGPIEGVKATGANAIQVIWFAVVPQIILPYISFTIYRWDINVRMATVIGLVGGGGIGTLLIQYQGQALWHEVGALAFLIVIVVWLMDVISAHIREALK